MATLPSVVVPPATHTDARPGPRGRDAAVGGDHHPLAVVEGRLEEGRTLGAVPARGPRGVAHEDVDLAGLQRGEPVLGLDVDELDRRGVAEHRGGDHPAEVGVEAHVLAAASSASNPGGRRGRRSGPRRPPAPRRACRRLAAGTAGRRWPRCQWPTSVASVSVAPSVSATLSTVSSSSPVHRPDEQRGGRDQCSRDPP